MAANKKNAKGSKTAHVLNLLTAPDAPKEGVSAGEDTAAAEQAAPAAHSRPLLPPILEVAQSNDDNLAQQIQHALEEELEGGPAAGPAAPPAAEPPVQSAAEQAPPPATEPVPKPEPSPAPEPVPAPESPAAKSAPRPPEEEDITYTNVMQVLVEEKAPRYIEKFGLCTCKHCAADVKALTLSNLVPKYVVLSKLDRIPMLTVYEGRYSTTIFAQLTRACKIVMDHPHHSRDN